MKRFDPAKIKREIQQFRRDLPRMLGNGAVNFFQERFEQETWIDKSRERWKPKKDGSDGGRGLLRKSGRLVRSIRIARATQALVVISTDVPYAKTHNEGGTVRPRVTQKMRRFAWAKYYQGRRTEEKWKALALTKKQVLTVNVPERPFMKKSRFLIKKLERRAVRELGERLS